MTIPHRSTRVQHGKLPSICYDAVAWVFSLEGGITHVEFRVLMCLARHYNKQDGFCFPSRATMAKECGMSPTGMSHALARLAESGLIRIATSGKRGRNAAPSNQYFLNMGADGVNSLHPKGELSSPHKIGVPSGNGVNSVHTNKVNTPSLTTEVDLTTSEGVPPQPSATTQKGDPLRGNGARQVAQMEVIETGQAVLCDPAYECPDCYSTCFISEVKGKRKIICHNAHHISAPYLYEDWKRFPASRPKSMRESQGIYVA